MLKSAPLRRKEVGSPGTIPILQDATHLRALERGRQRNLLKAIGLKEIEQIFSVIEPMGISREAVVIPLRTEHPGRVAIGAGGKLEIVVERDADFPEWIRGLADRVRAVMSREPG